MIDLFMEKMKMIWRWIRQNPLDAFLLLIGLILLAVLFAVMFSDYISCWAEEVLDSDRKRDTIQFIGWGIAGVLAIFGAVAVNRRAVAQVKVADAQVKNNELVEKGHIQERFKAAVEHLGSEHESVRIASFYEFYHLASDDEKVQKNIFDILRANLRLITASDEYKKEIELINGKEDSEGMKTTQEVRCLLDVLFRAKGRKKEFVFAKFSCNLKGLFLVGANLPKADLRKVKMRGADLQGADLKKADLRGVDLRGVKNLDTAKLSGAKVKDAIPPEGFQWPADVDATSDD